MKYNSRIYLEDDVQVDDQFITKQRFMKNKPSIYDKYGFTIEKTLLDEMKRLGFDSKYDNLYRNIPMMALNKDKFIVNT